MINSSYQNLTLFISLENNFDEGFLILWMQKHYNIPFITCALYTLAVLLIQRCMRNRPPVEFGAMVLPTWNALFTFSNLMVFMKVAPTRLTILWNYGMAHSNCHFYFHVGLVAFWNCIFFLTKFVWVIDTMFIILRKKTLTPFRFFHHISLFMYTWYLYTEHQGIVWLSFLNSLTTSVFYGVPLLTSLRPSATRAASLFMIFVSLLEVGFQQISKFFEIFVLFDGNRLLSIVPQWKLNI